MALGDYNQYRRQFRDVSTDYEFLAATDYTSATAKIAAKTGHEIMIQQIVLAVTTDNAATQTFQNNTAVTPNLIAKSKASPGIGPITWDFGPVGVSCGDGKSFDHLMSATGMAGRVSVLAYLRPTRDGSLTPSQI